MALKNLKKEQSLTDRAYQAIKAAIISNDLTPGTVLAEETLAAQLGISRTPIRAALQRLQLEKIVAPQGKNLTVAEVTEQDVRDIDVVRIQLEPLSVRLIAQRGGLNARQIKRLYACTEKQNAATLEGDNLTFLDQDTLFHVMLAQFSGNSFLVDLVRRSNLTIQRFHTLSGTLPQFASAAIEEHRAILRALEAHEYDAAEQALRDHLERVDLRILQP